MIFYAAEITAYRPGTSIYTYEQGNGTTPNGTFSQFADSTTLSTSVLRASDVGYRTSAAVDGDPVTYPPYIADAFQIDRKVLLPPGSPGIAASWGTLSISNVDNQYSAIVSTLNNDGRNLSILYGNKTLENFNGTQLSRSTNGTYFDTSGIMQTAGPNVTRLNYGISNASPNFRVIAGKIQRPNNGGEFIPYGIALSPDDLSFAVTNAAAQPLTTFFPGINIVRIAVADYSGVGGTGTQAGSYTLGSVANMLSYVNILTALGIVVTINDHTDSTLANNGGASGTNYTAGNGKLSPMTTWYSGWATATLGNAYVWYGTRNEPPNDSSGALTIEQQATYNAIRNTGNNCIIEIEQVGGGSPPGFTPMTMGSSNVDGLYPDSAYVAMTNIIWGPHYYNWLTGYSTSQSANAAQMTTMANLCQQQLSADGVVPVVFWEYGPSTLGTLDAGGNVTTAAMQASIYGSIAWAFDEYQSANSLTNLPTTSSKTTWGNQVATWLANAPVSVPISGGGAGTILIEPAATNYTRNARLEGTTNGVIGSGGVLPTNWAFVVFGGASGLAYSIIGHGTELGIPYFDIRFYGTASATPTVYLWMDTGTGIPALISQQWTHSFYTRIVGGTRTNVTSMTFDLAEHNSGGTSIQDHAASITMPNVGAALQRMSFTASTSNAACAYVRPRFQFSMTASTALDMTLRFGGPQTERGATATSLILPAIGVPATSFRAADISYTSRGIYIDPPYTTLLPVFQGVQAPWFLSEQNLQIPLRDASYWLDRPLQTNQYLGTGSYNGNAQIASLPLPMARGGTSLKPILNVTPTLIDVTNRIYQYNDARGTVVNLYQGGATSITFQADTTNLYVGTTTAGQYRTDNSRGLFQLGSIPTAAITCDVTGEFPIAAGYTRLAYVLRYTLTEIINLPLTYINISQIVALDATYPYTVGFFYGSSERPTGLDVLNKLLSGVGAKLYPARNGQLQVLVLRAPSGTPVATYDFDNTENIVPMPLDSSIDPAPYRIRVGYNQNNTVQTSGLLGAATAAHTQVIALPEAYGVASSATVLANYLRPNDLPAITNTALLDLTNANSVATALIALWGTRRRLYSVILPTAIGLLRDIGDIVQLVWPLDNLSSGQIGVVVGETFSSAEATITLFVLV